MLHLKSGLDVTIVNLFYQLVLTDNPAWKNINRKIHNNSTTAFGILVVIHLVIHCLKKSVVLWFFANL